MLVWTIDRFSCLVLQEVPSLTRSARYCVLSVRYAYGGNQQNSDSVSFKIYGDHVTYCY